MTHRERMLAAFAYQNPDRIPVVYHPSPAGLNVHGEKLVELFSRFPPDNPIRFNVIPRPPPGTIGANGIYREFRRDEWGTEWEYNIFGVQGHPKSYPFPSWREAASYRFPAPEKLVVDGLEPRENYLVIAGWVSIFEKLHALRPIDEVLMDLWTGDEDLLMFLDRMVEYWCGVIDQLIAEGADVIMFGDDWGTQTAPLVAPDLFRTVFKPRYVKMMQRIKQANRKIFYHCCGFLGSTLDELLDLGINGLWPQIKLFEADPANIEKCREHSVAIYIHPDRQRLIPRGTPAEIEAAIRAYADRYHRLQGGGIFYVEVENDAPFENIKALVEAVDRYR